MAYLVQYQLFQAALKNLAKDLGPDALPLTIKSQIADLQSVFTQSVATIDLDAIDPPANQRLQSLQVEIAKELRLLQMDSLFLQTAKQSETIQRRRTQVELRLKTLLRYCDIVLVGDSA